MYYIIFLFSLLFLFSSYLTSFGIFAYECFILIYLLVFDHVVLHHFLVVAPVITIYTLSFYSLFRFNILSLKVKHRSLTTTNFPLSCIFINILCITSINTVLQLLLSTFIGILKYLRVEKWSVFPDIYPFCSSLIS